MQQLILVLAAVTTVVLVTGALLPALTARADTPKARDERDRRLRDELGALG